MGHSLPQEEVSADLGKDNKQSTLDTSKGEIQSTVEKFHDSYFNTPQVM